MNAGKYPHWFTLKLPNDVARKLTKRQYKEWDSWLRRVRGIVEDEITERIEIGIPFGQSWEMPR